MSSHQFRDWSNAVEGDWLHIVQSGLHRITRPFGVRQSMCHWDPTLTAPETLSAERRTSRRVGLDDNALTLDVQEDSIICGTRWWLTRREYRSGMCAVSPDAGIKE